MASVAVKGSRGNSLLRGRVAASGVATCALLAGCQLLTGSYATGAPREDGGRTTDAASKTDDAGIIAEAGADVLRAALAFGSNGIAACEQCLATQCADEVQRLVQNADADPTCAGDRSVVTCAEQLPVSPSAELLCGLCPPGEDPELPTVCLECPLAGLGDCTFERCPECPFGRLFECSGAFEWPEPVDVSFPVNVFLVGAAAGTQVQFCERPRDREPDDEDCAVPIGDPAWTDVNGVARLVMGTKPAPPLGLGAYDAYLLVRETPTTWPQRIYFNRPWSRPTRDAFAVAQPKLDDGGTPPAEVSGIVIDCRGASNFARGVQIELSRADGLSTGEVAYSAGGNATSENGVFRFRGMAQGSPATMATVRVEDRQSGTVIVEGFEFPLRPGTHQQLRLWPDATNFPER